MFAHISTFAIFLFFASSLLVAVNAGSCTKTPPPTTQCSTGSLQCCNSVKGSSDPAVAGIVAGLLGIVLGDITGQVGLTCVPIVGGTSCSQQAACCTGNTFSGLITVGCNPININL